MILIYKGNYTKYQKYKKKFLDSSLCLYLKNLQPILKLQYLITVFSYRDVTSNFGYLLDRSWPQAMIVFIKFLRSLRNNAPK